MLDDKIRRVLDQLIDRTTISFHTLMSSISYVGKVNGIDITKNLMLDDSNSSKNVIHFMLPKPVVMQIAEQINKNGQSSSELMQFSLEPTGSIPPSAMASSHM
jgi:small nuclear ribonucleoprotein (snRNP)-like protein